MSGVDAGAGYIVMEYVKGVTLDRWLASPRPLRAVLDALAGDTRGGQEAAVVQVDLGRLLAGSGRTAEARTQFARAEPALRGGQGESRDYDLLALAALVVCDAADRRIDRARLEALDDAVATRGALSAEVREFVVFARARARAVLGGQAPR